MSEGSARKSHYAPPPGELTQMRRIPTVQARYLYKKYSRKKPFSGAPEGVIPLTRCSLWYFMLARKGAKWYVCEALPAMKDAGHSPSYLPWKTHLGQHIGAFSQLTEEEVFKIADNAPTKNGSDSVVALHGRINRIYEELWGKAFARRCIIRLRNEGFRGAGLEYCYALTNAASYFANKDY